MWLNELWGKISDTFSGASDSTTASAQCPHAQDSGDPNDLRPRVGVVLSFHPVLFRSRENPADASEFYVVDGTEFESKALLADGRSGAVVQIRLVRLDVDCAAAPNRLTTATVSDYLDEGEVVLRLSTGRHGTLLYQSQVGEAVRIPTSDLTDGLSPLDHEHASAVLFHTTREIGATEITATIEGACNFIACDGFQVPEGEQRWVRAVSTGSRSFGESDRGFDCRKTQWYLRRFGFLGHDANNNVRRNDSSNPWQNIAELVTDGHFGARSASAYRDFTILAAGTFRNQNSPNVQRTYSGGTSTTVDQDGTAELVQWMDQGYTVEPYHGLFDANTAAGQEDLSILYNAIVAGDSNVGHLRLANPIGQTRASLRQRNFVIADEIRCAIKLFHRNDLRFRLHDGDPNGKLDDQHMHANMATLGRATVAAIRREQVADFVGANARDVMIHSGYRGHAEQQTLYNRGRTTPGVPCQHGNQTRAVGTCQTHPLGATVTRAQPGTSWHNFGVAIDVVFCNVRGGATWPDGNNWARNGALAVANGLTWGGNWVNHPDRPHMQLPAADSPSQAIRNAYANTQGTVLQKLRAAWALL